MQPLPTGAFPEEVTEETPVQSENEPKVLDPEGDLLCIAKTFSYLRESGECRGDTDLVLGSLWQSLALWIWNLAPKTDGIDTHLQRILKDTSS